MIGAAEVAADPRAAAERALAGLRPRFDRYLVHFDVDAIDFLDMPLSENTWPNVGLPFAAACAALDVLVADERLAGLTVTEHDPAHGAEDGSTSAALAERLATALGYRPASSPAASRPSGAPQSSIDAGIGIP
jgi:arginase